MSIYGCHNKPRPQPHHSYVAQVGWMDQRDGFNEPCPAPIYQDIYFMMSTPCQYTKQHASDPECSGCVHRTKDAA